MPRDLPPTTSGGRAPPLTPAARPLWLMEVTPLRRLTFFIAGDLAIIAVATLLAFLLRFDGSLPRSAWDDAAFVTALAGAATVGSMALTGVYRVSWRFVAFREVLLIAAGSAFSALVLGAVVLLWHGSSLVQFPRGIVLVEPALAFLGIAGFRLWRRFQHLISAERQPEAGETTLLVGAGEAGEQVLRSILRDGARSPYRVVGLLDDDPLTHRTAIHGAEVLGPVAALTRVIQRHGVRTVIICIAQAPRAFVKDVVRQCQRAGVKNIRIIPPLHQLVRGEVSVQSTREVSLEDLLGRETVRIDEAEVGRLIQGQRILVTGGAGTIGAELCRQVLRFEPAHLVILDIDETRLHDLGLELRETHPRLRVEEALADIRRPSEVAEVLRRHRPQVVLHAAAFKHVPMMERWPLAALESNVLGTAVLAQAAEEHGCGRFLLISTDKAVEPSSVMGATKRLAEIALFGGPEGSGRMVRSAVRFGNVIGSRGSVIPTFERQLARGGPLTVTHPDVERFFMMTSEAVSLVLQAAALGKGNDLFILDMGKPVRILDVAREFCRLQGLEPGVDVPIVFTGLRRGEKLSELLSYPHERLEATLHPQVLRTHVVADGSAAKVLGEVERLVESRDQEAARDFLQGMFPSLDPAPPLLGPSPTGLTQARP